jgi:glutamate racemase
MIGIFDSGSGGLTVLKEIRMRLTHADILYFGDIKNAPYGIKSQEELVALTASAIKLLQERGATNIVSACNSVSAALAVSTAPKDMIEMIEPTVASFKDSSERILLSATPATIDSQIYQNAFKAIEKEVATVAIPDLAGAIEFGSGEDAIEKIISDAFSAIDTSQYDTLVLGCTHYPFARSLFEKLFPTLKIVDPAVAVAERVESQMSEEGTGKTTFLISKNSNLFRDRVGQLWPEQTGSIEVID